MIIGRQSRLALAKYLELIDFSKVIRILPLLVLATGQLGTLFQEVLSQLQVISGTGIVQQVVALEVLRLCNESFVRVGLELADDSFGVLVEDEGE